MLDVKKWRFITDKDSSLITAVARVFAEEILDGYGHHFICRIDRDKKISVAKMEFASGPSLLLGWAWDNGHKLKKWEVEKPPNFI